MTSSSEHESHRPGLREFFWPWTLAVMAAGGVPVMLAAAFAHWDGLAQNVALWAWLMTVGFFRAVWLLEGRPAVVKAGKSGSEEER